MMSQKTTDPIARLDAEAALVRTADELAVWWPRYREMVFAIRNERIDAMLLPEEKCKRCNEYKPGPSGLCSICERELHSADEAQNYNGWALTSSDEYRETGE